MEVSADGGTNTPSVGEQSFSNRLKSVSALTDALDRIRKEKNRGKEAENTSEKIHQLTHEARNLVGRGEMNQGRSILDRAYAMAKIAIEEMRRGDTLVNEAKGHILITKEKTDSDAFFASYGEQDFETRLKNVDALTVSLDRIIKEKNAGKEVQDSSTLVQQMTEEARKLTRAGEFDKGRHVLDKAYVIVRASMEQLRRGDTLAETRHLTSKEEEYFHEMDRNDTYRMLVGILIAQEINSLDPMVKNFIVESAELRRQANQQGESRKFLEAIKSLENSTMALIRAIRESGLNIPG
ncbi:MAG: hypothetical protein HQL77_18960 [Magnetococcales bacterium]|nr:hypothetical protein [Magnetococcales bacterium]